jgi:hypothetical protein
VAQGGVSNPGVSGTPDGEGIAGPREHRAAPDSNDRDDRVLMPLALAPRPPLPNSTNQEQADWSLLDPFKIQRPFWRQTSECEDAGQG